MKLLILLLTIIVLISGCAKDKPRENEELIIMLSQALDLSSPQFFEVTHYESSSVLGDYIEWYEIVYSEDDFQEVLNGVIKNDKEWNFIRDSLTQRVAYFSGHGFNRVVALLDIEHKLVKVRFIHE